MKTSVPFSLKLRLWMNSMFFVGFVSFLIGIPMVMFLFSPRVLNDGKLNSAHFVTKGVLVDYVETNTSVDEEVVMEFIYEYTTPENEIVTSFSYSTGFYSLEIGDSVNVQYHPEDFYMSRIEGMQTTKHGVGGFFSFFMLILGFIFCVVGIANGNKTISILSHGRPSWGKLVERRETNVRVNEQTVFKLTYEYKTEEGKIAKGTIKTHKTHAVTDEAYERLLYFPKKTRQILLLDNQKPVVKKFMENNFPEFSKPYDG